MPSRQPPQPPSNAAEGGPLHFVLLTILSGALVVLFLSVLVYVVRKLIYKRTATVPSDLKLLPPHRFSHSVLRRATSLFSDANRLGKGGVGAVYAGDLADGRSVAVKVMDSGSLQGEREFRNEILLAGRIGESERVLPILGFAMERRKRMGKGKELVLVYELMRNGSLQDALLYKKCVELMDWKVRFGIALDVAEGINFLHFVCDPPVIHCDIKPSNVLLDCHFRAKLADFGLASVKCGKGYCQAVDLVEGMRCVTEIPDGKIEGEGGGGVGNCKEGPFGDGSQFRVNGFKNGDGCSGFDRCLLQDGLCRDVDLEMSLSLPLKVVSAKQGNGIGTESGMVKNFPTERIGSEVMERHRSYAVDSSPGRAENAGRDSNDEVKHKKLPREWWKEEFCAELTNKSQKKRGLEASSGGNGDELRCQSDNEGVSASATKKAWKNTTIFDWCNQKLSFNILTKGRKLQDWTYGDPSKSHCFTSTPSMKGTVCYTAPEFSCAGQLSEKCDVYSFGVLLLVLISGRRPLEMTSSPMLDFERANLVTWARQLALSDKLLDLVDPDTKSLDEEQAMRCLTVALLCLQRSPAKRPSAKEIVQMLSQSLDPPHLPLNFSPSPQELHLQVSSTIRRSVTSE
ncbi:unnamed protein product [Rhodiola kirilowii]